MSKKRVTGKRTDPAYKQHSLWLPNALFAKVSRKLVTNTGRYEFSLLVEDLLTRWLAEGGELPSQE